MTGKDPASALDAVNRRTAGAKLGVGFGLRILVTGGVGFIGSAVVRQYIARTDATVINLDKLTYAASPEAVAEFATNAGCTQSL